MRSRVDCLYGVSPLSPQGLGNGGPHALICHSPAPPGRPRLPPGTGDGASATTPSQGGLMSGTTEIRPFRVDMPDEAIADLRRRIAATRWSSRELVDDRSQGVQLATIQELARYWAAQYDWRACEAELNALPQFTTEIEGVDVHFIHVKSPHQDALPL